jgi:hypothetical protein
MSKRRFLALHPLIGTKHKPAPLSDMERSPYYWWWAYLRRNEDYLACCENEGKGELARLYQDFLDVRPDDFRGWWGGELKRGAYLFSEERIKFRMDILRSKSDWDEEWSADDVLVIALNRHINRQKLMEYFGNKLREEEIGAQGRLALKRAKSTARYPLHRNFSQYNLKAMLATYDVWVENERLPKGEKMTLWQIGEKLRLVPTAMTHKSDSPHALVDKKNVMTVAVSRYVKQAKAIIANTAKGEFPNSRPPSKS